ncbi:DUF998 domain-containing protein [Candidatus Bathyarchaeota archaeon]|nr:DUF998 domain-containing protein [Candidatus Bathyarchaeota archaeon]
MNSTRPDRMLGILAICGIVGPIIYTIVLTVFGFFWPGYNPISQYMSELGAVDAPHAIVMNVLGFQLLGIFMIGFGFGLYRSISKGWGLKNWSGVNHYRRCRHGDCGIFPM